MNSRRKQHRDRQVYYILQYILSVLHVYNCLIYLFTIWHFDVCLCWTLLMFIRAISILVYTCVYVLNFSITLMTKYYTSNEHRNRLCRDNVGVEITSTTAISAFSFYHYSCEFDSCPKGGLFDTIIYDKVCQWHVVHTVRWFSKCRPDSATNNTDRHDISEILLNAYTTWIITFLVLMVG